MIRIRILAFLALMVASTATAEEPGYFLRGNDLLLACESKAPTDKSLCEGYIIGVASTLSDPGMAKVRVCIPDGVVSGQVILIVVKWFKENPRNLHQSAAANIAYALSNAFPCSK